MVIKKLEKSKLDFEKVIAKGANTVADSEEKIEWVNFTLRIRTDLLRDVTEMVKSRLGMNKTSWILEAIQEKLKRENG